jgi:hypothetical protein
MDISGDGSLSSSEFCTSIKRLVLAGGEAAAESAQWDRLAGEGRMKV